METHAESGFIVVDRQLQTSCQNSQQSQGQQLGHRTYYYSQPVRIRCRKKKQYPSALARSRKRHTFPGKELAEKSDLALPEEKSITTVSGVPDANNSLGVKELQNTSLTGCNDGDLVSLEDPTSIPDSDSDLSINKQAILRKFLDTVNIDSDDSDEDLNSVHVFFF